MSLCGIFVLTAVAWFFSADRKKMNGRLLLWGVLLQLIIGALVFVVPAGTKAFLFLNNAVVRVLDSAVAGSRFVFGRLALSPGQVNEAGETSLGFILAFQAFPTIIFFSALISILYFVRIMPPVIRGFAYVFTRFLRISGAEAVVAAGNIFVGVESALTVRPYLEEMTDSELCTVLTAGMATVASNVLGIYVFALQERFPTIAGHLISASLLSAPAAVVMSKILLPESGSPRTLGTHVKPLVSRDRNLFEAVLNGANAGVRMIVGIVALLIAILGLVHLADTVLCVAGSRLNGFFGISLDWSLKGLCGYLFYPFTLVTGVPVADAGIVSRIVGERLIVTEVVSYQDLAAALANGCLTSPRSVVLATYSLCGFAHLASMAIFVGGTAALVPGRIGSLSRVACRALVAATLACLQTACVAGTFFTEGSILIKGG